MAPWDQTLGQSSGIWEAAQKAKLSPCVVVLRNPTAVWEDSHTSERHYHPHILEGSTASLIFTLISLNFRHEGTGGNHPLRLSPASTQGPRLYQKGSSLNGHAACVRLEEAVEAGAAPLFQQRRPVSLSALVGMAAYGSARLGTRRHAQLSIPTGMAEHPRGCTTLPSEWLLNAMRT